MPRPSVQTSVYIDPSLVARHIGPVAQDSVSQAAQRTVSRARSNIRTLGRIDTGEMYRSMNYSMEGSRLYPKARVYSKAKHTGHQEYGTKGHTMPPGRFMVFKPKGSGTFVFARKVRGIKAGRFMRNAFSSLHPSDFQ